MNIRVAKSAGFCYGVNKTVNELNNLLLNHNGKIYCYGEIIHNKMVIDSFKEKGVQFVESLDSVKDNVVIRAHGIKKEEYDLLKSKNINLVDLTCPNVLRIHDLVCDYANKGYFIILIGIESHPETIGTFSFCGDNSIIIDKEIDYDELNKKLKSGGLKDILVVAQTTYNSKKFDDIVNELKSSLTEYNFVINKTICNATEVRQKEVESLSKEVDLMIVIGDKMSSNSNKLNDIAKLYCKNVLFIESERDLDLDYIKNLGEDITIGITAGASTPKDCIDGVIKLLEK